MNQQQPRADRDLLEVDPKDREVYGQFSLVHLTAYSVYWLERWNIPTSYENVSVLNARLFPQDFSMSGFPQFPDGLRTNRSLLQMRPKYRGFATSNPRKGVFLSEKGRSEVTRVIEAIGAPTFHGMEVVVDSSMIDRRAPNRERARTISAAQEISERRDRLLFQRFAEGRLGDTDVVHLLGFLGLYDHTAPQEVRREFKRLRQAGETAGDTEFVAFMDAVGERFHGYLNRPSITASPRE